MVRSADPSAPARPKRPFWMHQFAEYLLGAVLVAQGLQSPTPAMPAFAGGLIVLNVAIARGPLSAFGLVHRQLHRVLDIVVIAVVVAFAVQPWVEVEATARLTMVVIAGVMGFIWWQSSFVDKGTRRPPVSGEDGRSTEIGRLAGRAAAGGILAARRMKDARKR